MRADVRPASAAPVSSPAPSVTAHPQPRLLARADRRTDRESPHAVPADHGGMEITTMVYRANRLAPLALNLPEVCQTLGADLRPVAIAFWSAYPTAEASFLLEASRFCEFLYQQLATGRRFGKDIRATLDREAELVRMRLRASQGHA